MNNKRLKRQIGGCALGIVLVLTACGGSDDGDAESSSGGGGDYCTIDSTVVGSAVGGLEIKPVELDPGCRYDGPGALSITTTDTVLQIDLIEGDGATQYGPTSDELGLGIAGSKLAENDSGWFSYSGVIGDQRLTVANGVNRDDVYYDSPELRTLAEQALTDWVAAKG